MKSKEIPVISQILRDVVLEDFADAIRLITDESFNPNETTESWGAPIVSAIITLLSGNTKIKDQNGLKIVLKGIVNNEKFDANIIDSQGETILMNIARNPDFNWLVPFILEHKGVDLNIKNFMKRDAVDIANRFHNNTFADILLSYKISNDDHSGLPKKKVGAKKKIIMKTTETVVRNSGDILSRLEFAFYPEAKKNPVSLYGLMTSFFKGDYTTCIQIVRDPQFNPNETDKWDEPVISSMIYYTQDKDIKYDDEMFKQICDIIIANPRFNVNCLDGDCNTVLMVSMGFPQLKWLTEKLFKISSARLDVINDLGESVREIAKNCNSEEFYNSLCRQTFQETEIIE